MRLLGVGGPRFRRRRRGRKEMGRFFFAGLLGGRGK